jgi:hypothetical protein
MFQRALLSAVFTVGAHRCAAQCVDEETEDNNGNTYTCDTILETGAGMMNAAGGLCINTGVTCTTADKCGNGNTICFAYGVEEGTLTKDHCPFTCDNCVTPTCNTYTCTGTGYTLKLHPATINGASNSECCDGATAASPSVSLILRNLPGTV